MNDNTRLSIGRYKIYSGYLIWLFYFADVTQPLLVEVDQIYHLACPASPIFYKYNPVKVGVGVFAAVFLKYLWVSLILPYISADNKDECHWHTKHAGTCQASRSKVRECGSLSIYLVPLYTDSSQLGFCGTGSCSRQLLKYTEIPLSIHNPRHTGVMLIQSVSFLSWLILSEPVWLKHL